jgi:hypothetical protein
MATSKPGPWTTGKVIIANPAAAGGAETFTLSGKDSRGANGAGEIHMVAGSLSTRNATGVNANRGWLRLNLKPADQPSKTRVFRIFGPSTEIGWSWRIAIGGETVASAINQGPIVYGGGEELFVAAFINSINANAGASGCSASALAGSIPAPDHFSVTCTCDFDFIVGDASGGNECKIFGIFGTGTNNWCPFNPTIVQVLPRGVPMLSPSALLVLSGLLIAVGLAVGRNRRSATPGL